MEKDRTIRGFFILLVAISLIAAWAGFWILHQTGHMFGGYISIPLYFFVFGCIYIYMIKRARVQPAKNSVRTFVSIRMFKLFISILTVILCGLVFRSHIKEFVITFLSFYIVYMILETAIFWVIRNDDKEELN